MASTDHDVRQFESDGRDKPATANSNYDNERSTAEIKRKPSAMTRRMSFSRPWSSYAKNYSSCLSGLRRNSSEQLYRRQGSLQSSPTTSCNDLSNSLDSGQLRKLKTATHDSEVEPKTFKISAMHARPFHQRRWSSPVAFSVAKLASSHQKASKHFDEENGSGGVEQDCSKDKNEDKICETDEYIIRSQKQDKTPDSSTPHCKGGKMESEVIEKTSNDSPALSCGRAVFSDQNLMENRQKEVNREAGKVESTNMDKSQPLTDETKSESLSISSVAKEEEPTQSRNIYTEIKRNTKWSKSKRFRRRHHTIHTDSRRFLNPTLFTIAEQSSGSFGSVIRNDTCSDQVVTGKLTSRRSKSLGDLNTLSDDMKTNGVSVQQLCAKSISVSVTSNNIKKSKEPGPPLRNTTVVYKGEEKSTSNRQISCPVQVNIQQFNQIQISPGIERKHKPQASKIQSYYPTQQHAIFTQPKAKWTSITISQV
ncbi:uncharacterized protein LOC114527077 [Dendronephthya gigantea]|uniref:uncharacterized protein LOC114527077 n=1 Tax=Dendronephthya gigantea TaxID=151771 RepID=UPI00106D69DA|nr:uncharacterized protein LOC114527077 [Dendronephthya gigantea]